MTQNKMRVKGLKPGNLMSSKDGLKILEISLALKMSNSGRSSFRTKKQQMNTQVLLRKSLRRKDICLNRFLMQMKVPYYRQGEMTQRTFSGKEEKPAPEFKAGRVRLTPLFCANVVEFMISMAIIYKSANPEP